MELEKKESYFQICNYELISILLGPGSYMNVYVLFQGNLDSRKIKHDVCLLIRDRKSIMHEVLYLHALSKCLKNR